MAQLNRNRKGAITQIWGKGDIQLTEGVRGNTYAAGRSVMEKNPVPKLWLREQDKLGINDENHRKRDSKFLFI